MKRLISFLMVACIGFAQICFAQEESAVITDYSRVVFSDDFESYTKDTNVVNIGTSWSDKYVQETGNTRYIRSASDRNLPDAELHGNVFERGTKTTNNNYWRLTIFKDDALSGPIASATPYFSNFKKVRFGYEFLATDYYKRNLNVVTNNGGLTNVPIAYLTEEGYITKDEDSDKKAQYELNVWNKVEFEIDFKNAVYAIYLNGEVVEDKISIPDSITKIQSFGISELKSSDETNEHTMYLDNIEYRTEPKLDITSANIADGSSDIAINEALTIEFNYDLAELPKDAVTVEKTEEKVPVENIVLNKQKNILVVTFKEKMDFNTDYFVTVSKELTAGNGQKLEKDTVISYKTMKKGLVANIPVFYDKDENVIKALPESGYIKASVNIYNPYEVSKKLQLYVGVYGQDDSGNENALEKLEKSSLTEIAPLSDGSINVPVSMDSFENRYVKAFLLDENMALTASEFAFMGENSPEHGSFKTENTTVSFKKEPELTGDILSFSTVLADAQQGTVLVSLKKLNELVLLEPVYTDETGVADYSHKMKVGNYILSVTGRNVSNSVEKELLYLPDDEKQKIADDINSSETVQEFKEKTEKYIANKLLVLDEADRTATSYQLAFEQRKNNTTYDSFILQMQAAEPLLEKINQSDWEGLYDLLIKNGKVILNDTEAENEDYDIFDSKTEDEQKAIAKATVRSEGFTDFDSFRIAFSEALKTYKIPETEEENNNTTVPERVPISRPSGGGGGGGGSSKPAPAPEVTDKPEEENSSETKVEEDVFLDLGQAEWAQESILALYREGIISEASDKKYRPADNITREEFVKLLVMLTGIDTDNKSNVFEDAKPDGWYVPYLTAAKDAGIIKGREDNTFGIGENISRQDMAVMAYRAVISFGAELPATKEKVSFSDEESISDYALEAIEVMQQAEIINGMGGGSFVPAGNANRAQAATIIYKIFNVIKEVR